MNANKDVLLVKPQNSVVSKEFLALPLTLPVILASYPPLAHHLLFPVLLTFPHQVPQKKAGAKDTPNPAPASCGHARCVHWLFGAMHGEKPRWAGDKHYSGQAALVWGLEWSLEQNFSHRTGC